MRRNKILFCLIAMMIAATARADICPDPQTSSLQWGAPPPPWQPNPYSPKRPEGDDNTRFAQAKILRAGYGQGVVCFYDTSEGRYSIWWQVRVRIPSPLETQWVSDFGGYSCQQSLSDCMFTTIR
jgi:hypothetical protein